MFTRCPQCKTVHPLRAALVAHARGQVRCGQCGRSFSALNTLFDDWPAGEAHGPAMGANSAPPVLGAVKTDQDQSDNTSPENDEPVESASTRNKLAWAVATAALILLTVANTAWTFREPLMKYSVVSTLLNKTGWLQIEREGLLKDPQQVQLVSRDIHAHPTRSGILVLNLTFVNLAQRTQVYPELELTLLDASNQAVARRRLQPTDYLRTGVNIKAGLAADVFLPVLLELGDPGEQAVGFEIQFL